MFSKIWKVAAVLGFTLLLASIAYADVGFSPLSGEYPVGSTLEATIVYTPPYSLTIWGIDAYVTYDTAAFNQPTNANITDYVTGLTKDINAGFLPGIVKYSAFKMASDPGWGPISGASNVYKLALSIKGPQQVSPDPPFNTTLNWRPNYCNFLRAPDWVDVTGVKSTGTYKIVERIASMSPNSGNQGQSISGITLWGDYTEFTPGETVIVTFSKSGGSGITVTQNGTASNAYTVTGVAISIASNATLGQWNVRMQGQTSGEIAIGLNLFTVNALMPAVLDLTAYFQGYYDPSNGTSRANTVEVEIRDTMNHIAQTYSGISVNTSGNAQVSLTNLTPGNYYVVLKHERIPANQKGINHLSIITAQTASFNNGVTTAIHFSDPSSPNYKAAYKPSPSDPDPMWTETNGKKSLRAGDASGDGGVNVTDYGIWYQQNGQTGEKEADFNGDKAVTIADYSLWYQNNGYASYVPDAPLPPPPIRRDLVE